MIRLFRETLSVMQTIPQNIHIVIPAWNEEKTLRSVVLACLEQNHSVVVVDDCSTDNTVSSVADLPITLLSHSYNQGKSKALVTGFNESLRLGATHVITLDADGQHDPKDIPSLLKAVEQRNNAIIIAARLLGREIVPFERRLGNRIADFWISWTCGVFIPDSQSGFRLYPSELLQNMDFQKYNQKSFVFESEILILAARKKFSIRHVPIMSCYPEDRRASYFHPVKDVWAIVLMITKHLVLRGMHLPGLYRSLLRRASS